MFKACDGEWLCERVTESLHAFNAINWPWHIKVQSGHNNKVTFRMTFFLRFNVLVYLQPNPKTNVWYTFWHFLNSFTVSFLWIDSRFNYSGSETRNQFTGVNTAFQINPCIIRISNFSFARDMITSFFSLKLGIFHFYISHNTPCLPPRPANKLFLIYAPLRSYFFLMSPCKQFFSFFFFHWC